MAKKDYSAWFSRASLIGDTIMFLPALNLLKKTYPNCYTIFPISQKTCQSAPLFINHPIIDKIHVLGEWESLSQQDYDLALSCDIRIDCFPSHPKEQDWYNYRNIYEETWIMAGLPLSKYYDLYENEKRPYLDKWFSTDRKNKSVSIWPFAGYAKDNQRSPSLEWWQKIVSILIKDGFKVYHYGHQDEKDLSSTIDYYKCTSLSFFDQVKHSLGCDFNIGTDSGSSLVLGAYMMPQITLLTNWNIGHNQNFNALAPNNPKNISIFKEGGCDNVLHDVVLDAVKLM